MGANFSWPSLSRFESSRPAISATAWCSASPFISQVKNFFMYSASLCVTVMSGRRQPEPHTLRDAPSAHFADPRTARSIQRDVFPSSRLAVSASTQRTISS